MWWTSSDGKIELSITKADAASCSHSGSCDADVKCETQKTRYYTQLWKLDIQVVASTLKKYGCWDEVELQDHEQNLQRLFWIACNDIHEGNI